mgnify:CR=1 FL=1
MAQIETMMEEIKGMTVLELNELVKALEEEFGVSAAAAAPVMVAGAGAGAAAGAAAPAEERPRRPVRRLLIRGVAEPGASAWRSAD